MTAPPGTNNGVGIILAGEAATEISLRDRAKFSASGSFMGRVTGIECNKNGALSVLEADVD